MGHRCGRRLAVVEFDRQRSNTCATWCNRCFSRRSVHDFHDGKGLCLDPRPFRHCVRSPLRFWHRRGAWGNPSTSYALTGAAPFMTQGGYAGGWSAGVGVDYAITNGVFGRIEYRYTNLSSRFCERRNKFRRRGQSRADQRFAGRNCVQIWRRSGRRQILKSANKGHSDIQPRHSTSPIRMSASAPPDF
jgi:hypothetical protein